MSRRTRHRRHRMAARFGYRYRWPAVTVRIIPDVSRMVAALRATSISVGEAARAFAEMERRVRAMQVLSWPIPEPAEFARLRGGPHA